MSVADRLAELGAVRDLERYAVVSEADLAEIERRLGAALPPDYREFAASYGACRFEEMAVVTLSENGLEIPVTEFFGGGADSSSVLAMQEEYAEPGAFPIAHDSFGDLFFLCATDPEAPGSIWYYQYSAGDRWPLRPDGTWPFPAYRAAISFTDLLARTRVEAFD